MRTVKIRARDIPSVMMAGLNAKFRNVCILSPDFFSHSEIPSISLIFQLPTSFKQKSNIRRGERTMNAQR
ncbi:MAG: hypothetical protein LBH96_01890 [Candidatus Peribacteria bacterium]|jgi:hypothetical protein|nr:hypothetical protein [Candidatus Peribacteria bacterium]